MHAIRPEVATKHPDAAPWLIKGFVPGPAAVGVEGGAGGDQVADGLGQTEAGGHLDGAAEVDDLRLKALFGKVAFGQLRVGGGNAQPGQVGRAGVRPLLGEGDGEAAAAEVQLTLDLIGVAGAGGAALEGGFLEDVVADDAEVAHAVHDQLRDVVIAHEEHIEGEVFGVQEQLFLRGLDLDAAAGEQIERVGGEAAALLDGEAEAVFGRSGGRHGAGGREK